VLVTNPPYSGEHKVNLLKFLATHTRKTPSLPMSKDAISGASPVANNNDGVGTDNKKQKQRATPTSSSARSPEASNAVPFVLLLPVYVATKSYWKDFAAQQASIGRPVFYILPPDYYEYSHPEGTGKDIPPFYSAWFVGGLSKEDRARLVLCTLYSLYGVAVLTSHVCM
jgi:hypothetical protein